MDSLNLDEIEIIGDNEEDEISVDMEEVEKEGSQTSDGKQGKSEEPKQEEKAIKDTETNYQGKVSIQSPIDPELMEKYTKIQKIMSPLATDKNKEVVDSVAAGLAGIFHEENTRTQKILEDIEEKMFIQTSDGQLYKQMKAMAPDLTPKAAMQMIKSINQNNLLRGKATEKKANMATITQKESKIANALNMSNKDYVQFREKIKMMPKDERGVTAISIM